MLVCMGCQGYLDENGKFISTPCLGLLCQKNDFNSKCKGKCRPENTCKILSKKLNIDNSSDCSSSCAINIKCGNKSKGCRGCFKTPYFKSVVEHGKKLCIHCTKSREDTNVSSKT